MDTPHDPLQGWERWYFGSEAAAEAPRAPAAPQAGQAGQAGPAPAAEPPPRGRPVPAALEA